MEALAPLPIRDDWTPKWLKPRGVGNRDFAYSLIDGQGMYSRSGVRRHGGVDWYAPGGTPVRAPVSGQIVDSRPSLNTAGQVYGGVIAVQDANGRCWTFRHVTPERRKGDKVAAGQRIATVTRWSDVPSASHAHIEIWRTFSGGYWFENAIDPGGVKWVMEAGAPQPEQYGFEVLPARMGGDGPDVVNNYTSKVKAHSYAALRRLRLGEKISTVFNGKRYFLLRWKPGTYGRKFRWMGYSTEVKRNTELQRQQRLNPGVTFRPFTGNRNSLYPVPLQKEA